MYTVEASCTDGVNRGKTCRKQPRDQPVRNQPKAPYRPKQRIRKGERGKSKTPPLRRGRFVAVAVGFEPTEGCPSRAFEARSFGRSDTLPGATIPDRSAPEEPVQQCGALVGQH